MNRSSIVGLTMIVLMLIAITAIGISDPTDAGKKKKKRVPAMARNTYVIAIKGSAGGSAPDVRSVTVTCDAGDKVLSGGFDELDETTNLRTNSPSDGAVGVNLPNEWIVSWYHDGSDDLVDVFALCSDFPPLHQPEA